LFVMLILGFMFIMSLLFDEDSNSWKEFIVM
jgi:hypothetical protein